MRCSMSMDIDVSPKVSPILDISPIKSTTPRHRKSNASHTPGSVSNPTCYTCYIFVLSCMAKVPCDHYVNQYVVYTGTHCMH